MMQKNIVCRQCGGTGKVPLGDALAATLSNFTKYQPRFTVPQLHEYDDRDDIGITALNNRLEELRNLGFIDRERTRGYKGWTYFLKPNKGRAKA